MRVFSKSRAGEEALERGKGQADIKTCFFFSGLVYNKVSKNGFLDVVLYHSKLC